VRSLQLRVLRLGLLQDGDVGIGVFPRGKELLVTRKAKLVASGMIPPSTYRPDISEPMLARISVKRESSRRCLLPGQCFPMVVNWGSRIV
jgi:hypothetical protein